MTHSLSSAVLAALVCAPAWADSIDPAATPAPFTINLAAFGGSSAVSGTTIASALSYPYGITVGGDGSILFGTNTPLSPNGLEAGPSTGGISSISPLGNGSYSAPVPLAGGLNGPVQSVNVLNTSAGQDLIVDSGANNGRTITIYNSANTQIGQLQFTYSVGNWEHPTGIDLVQQISTDTYRVFLGIGSETDRTLTTDPVHVAGLGLSSTLVNADSVYELTIQADSTTAQADGAPVQVVTGVRNAYGLQLGVGGELIVGDNGQDGAHNPDEIGADTLNIVPAVDIGTSVSDFGYPSCFTSFTTGQQIGCNIPPLAAFTPTVDSNGVLQYSEGLAAMACVSPGQMWFVGSQGGCFLGFHGTKDATGADNYDDAVLYYDFASGVTTPIIDGGVDGIGHLDSITVSGSTLFLGDLATNGVVDYSYGNSGAIYEFDLGASTPEPGTWAIAVGLALIAAQARKRSNREATSMPATGSNR